MKSTERRCAPLHVPPALKQRYRTPQVKHGRPYGGGGVPSLWIFHDISPGWLGIARDSKNQPIHTHNWYLAPWTVLLMVAANGE